jgi:4-hydroxy-tetrahydrodipicolinate synthase
MATRFCGELVAVLEVPGVYAIAVTPFLDDGRIDDSSTLRMVEFYRGCGITGLTILGVMGEATKLDTQEAIGFARRVIGACGPMPVIVGVSAPGFAAMRALARSVMEAGAAAVMIAPPGSVRTDDQIVGYFAQAVEAIGEDVPFVIQDYPPANGVVMAVPAIRRIVDAHPSCAMLKHEDWPGLEKLTAVRRLMDEGAQNEPMRRIPVLVGNGGVFLDFEMERGADGAMTGYAFPDMLVDVVRLQKAGEREAAHDLFDAHLPLMRYEQQPGPGLAVRKHILSLRGAIHSDAQRKPATPISPIARAEVSYLLSRLARRDARARGLA